MREADNRRIICVEVITFDPEGTVLFRVADKGGLKNHVSITEEGKRKYAVRDASGAIEHIIEGCPVIVKYGA